MTAETFASVRESVYARLAKCGAFDDDDNADAARGVRARSVEFGADGCGAGEVDDDLDFIRTSLRQLPNARRVRLGGAAIKGRFDVATCEDAARVACFVLSFWRELARVRAVGRELKVESF